MLALENMRHDVLLELNYVLLGSKVLLSAVADKCKE